jgi:hypothetical protein
MKQTLTSEKVGEIYQVKVFHDEKLVWTDEFKTKESADWFIQVCKKDEESADEYGDSMLSFSPEEARKRFLDGETRVHIFYRHPRGYRFTFIY